MSFVNLFSRIFTIQDGILHDFITGHTVQLALVLAFSGAVLLPTVPTDVLLQLAF